MLNLYKVIFSQWRRLVIAAQHFNESDGWVMSSHVALSFMISVFPFIIFAASFAGLLGTDVQSENLTELIFRYWPEALAEPIKQEINVVLTQGNAGFLTLGIGLTLIFASNGVEAVRVALMRAYKDNETRSFWKLRLQSFVFVLIGALLLSIVSILLFFVPLYLSFFETTSKIPYEYFFQSEILTSATALLLLVFIVFACHYWLPVRRRSLSDIWPGIAVTLFLWAVSANLFARYIEIFANYSATYAGLAGFMTAIFFLYLMAVILIFGAEFNSTLSQID